MKNSTQIQLNKAYTKRFKHLNKNLTTTADAGLLIFIEHLKYLRDSRMLNLISNSEKSVPSDPLVASLSIAITEFEMYQKSKKAFHWRNFCEFVKINAEEWLKLNDSV